MQVRGGVPPTLAPPLSRHMTVPAWCQPAALSCHLLSQRSAPVQAHPHTERVTSRVLSLPMFPELTRGQKEMVIDAVRKFFKR